MRIYFSGLGGVSIGPLSQIAHDAGHDVLGSEPTPNLMTARLIQYGITVQANQDGSYLRAEHALSAIDWFVYTAALPDDHPELQMARQLGIRTSKRDEFLRFILDEHDLKLIAFSGTHGKTTTTGMMVWVMQELGLPISCLVGTTLSFGSSGRLDSKSEYFIYECDEFDRNMLQYEPTLSVITSLDYDHPDTYPTEDIYTAAFRQFIDQSDAAIMWQSDADYIHAHHKELWCLQSNEVLPLKLAGEHNRQNATLVLKALERLQIGDPTRNRTALEAFPGTERRFEKLADNLYSDYGHHPTEVATTLQMARELSDHVVLVYQPHQNIRQHRIRDMYTDCMIDAETIYWLPTYLSREDPHLEVLTPEQLTENLTNRADVTVSDLDTTLWREIAKHRKAGHLVLCMGAGTIDGWVRDRLTNS